LLIGAVADILANALRSHTDLFRQDARNAVRSLRRSPVAGVLLGGAAAYAAGRGMQALLAGVSPADAPTFAAAIALSLGMTFLGSLAPALRAARVDPAIALRTE
jgi:hypothetical protein